MHAAGGAGDLVGESLTRGGQRIGVRHLEDAGDTAHDGRERAGREVLLVLETGLAEMHLGVDNAWEDVEALAVGGDVGGVGSQRAERGNAAGADADVGGMRAVLIDDGAVLEDRVVVRHVSLTPCKGHTGFPHARE